MEGKERSRQRLTRQQATASRRTEVDAAVADAVRRAGGARQQLQSDTQHAAPRRLHQQHSSAATTRAQQIQALHPSKQHTDKLTAEEDAEAPPVGHAGVARL